MKFKHKEILFFLAALACGLCLTVLLLWLAIIPATWYRERLVERLPDPELAGLFGDSFGAFTAASSLAGAFLVGLALILQVREFGLMRKEYHAMLEEQRNARVEAATATEVQRAMLSEEKLSRIEAERAREVQEKLLEATQRSTTIAAASAVVAGGAEIRKAFEDLKQKRTGTSMPATFKAHLADLPDKIASSYFVLQGEVHAARWREEKGSLVLDAQTGQVITLEQAREEGREII